MTTSRRDLFLQFAGVAVAPMLPNVAAAKMVKTPYLEYPTGTFRQMTFDGLHSATAPAGWGVASDWVTHDR